ncbi:VCBS repeat-containing protein [Flagellimonas okinawensis]|uniref:VCBS repeat-containing protein n=1 Tax=Flagellimonas okinawensis TaxID=3031324 RepID=A0ABT5XQW3_9FLAO|nr:VCBS repeat-containing protein [[Muricauda] okinawensis]MDF0708292.1 VCBS repeat-containing protein [[Muricauda] okinawensis]
MTNFRAYLLLCTLIIVSCTPKKKTEPLFELLDTQTTHIDFTNKLMELDTMNIVGFEYMYNGAGVAVGDINNDGLKDLYFTGNQVADRLYINKGDFQFEDISESAHIVSTGWSNGVTMTDINEDGLLDIYVSRGGTRDWPREDWANRLFVNNGDGTFTDRAKEYGIADTGYSVQAVFFDFDKDGDRDLYVLTNALVDYNRNTSKYKTSDGSADSTDRLYRNNGDGTFTNISWDAGISMEGFGLGVSVCDINKDGWLDLYISNDFLTDDLLYVNNQDGTFTDRLTTYFRHLSYNGMGNDMGDLNNDGNPEVITVDMFPNSNERIKQTMMKPSLDVFSHNITIGYAPQFVRNTLQLNNGNQTFSEIGQFSGIHNTDWSWAPLIADFDNDGLNDIFITNGYRRDITNLDYQSYTQRPAKYQTEDELIQGELERVSSLPEVKLSNYIYKNNGDLTFSNKMEEWGLDKPLYSNGAAFADLDNDGDLDLVVNNIDDPASIYKNNTIAKTKPMDRAHYLAIALKGKAHEDLTGSSVSLYHNGKTQYKFFSTVRGYLSTMDAEMHFGLGDSATVDSLQVVWYNGQVQTLYDVTADQHLTLDIAHASEAMDTDKKDPGSKMFHEIITEIGVAYEHMEDDFDEFKLQTTLLKMNTNLGPGIAVGDINGDSLEDFYVGGTKERTGKLYVQRVDATFEERSITCAGLREDMGVVFVDVDGDGDLDLLSVDGGGIEEMARQDYKDAIFYNDGTGNFDCGTFLGRKARGGSLELADFDRDGDLDVFVGGRVINGFYPKSPKSYLLRNDPDGFKDISTEVFGNQELGMVSDALWTDFDNDGWFDLILVGEFMEITFMKNNKGSFANVTGTTGLEFTQGWWNSIVAGDFDSDGDMDYVVGNFGLNSDFKCSPEQPLTIYTKDIDGNGTIDPLISCYREGEEHLIHTRDILVDQISAMKGKFKDYESYAKADFNEVKEAAGLEDAGQLKVYEFASGYIENLGNGKFTMVPLPKEVQFSPVFGMLVEDFNRDGNLDLLVTGNQFDIEPFIGQSDASIGYCLLGDGNGGFTVVSPNKSGLSLSGSAKGTAMIQLADGTSAMLIGNNSGKLRAYGYDNTGMARMPIGSMDAFAEITTVDGQLKRVEFPYGNTYLGNPSRTLGYHKGSTADIKITDYQGNTRELKVVGLQ